MTRAAFLDRDGLVTALVPDPQSGLPESPNHLSELRLLPGAAAAINALHEGGYLVVCVTNQPSAAKEKTTAGELLAIQAQVEARLAPDGAFFDDTEICLHHPEGSDPALTVTCACRKPAPGMLLAAAARLGIDLAASWMVGDSDTDVLAGQRAGCRTLLVEHAASAHRRSSSAAPDGHVEDLAAAVRVLLAVRDG